MGDNIYIDNKPICKVDDSKKYFLNVLTILYGPTGSGKSSIILHILNTLRDVVPMGFICSPTNANNGDYNKIMPPQCIYDDLTADLMKKLFIRQTDCIAMYKMVRDITSLKPIFKLIADNNSLIKIQKLDKIIKDSTSKVRSTYDDDEIDSVLEELQTRYEKKVVNIMRNCIRDNKHKLQRIALSDIQKSLLDNFEINPNLLLIIDDCAASIKEWKDLVETKKLFFQGRHYKITTILTMQNESIIPVPLRSNAHISIFTTKKITTTFFLKASSGASPEERKRIEKIAAHIFAASDNNSRPNYKKLIVFGNIIATEDKIQYMIANPKRKRFGSNPYWKFCDNIKRETPNAITKNSFTKMFNLKQVAQLE
jgi:hypothetical protein